MKPMFLAFVFLFAALVLFPFSLRAQDKEVDEAIKQAADAAKQMGVKMPDIKKQLEEVDKEEAKVSAQDARATL